MVPFSDARVYIRFREFYVDVALCIILLHGRVTSGHALGGTRKGADGERGRK